jgi:hypothetical protein
MNSEKIRNLDVNGFMINAGIEEVNKIKTKIEELEVLKTTKEEEVEIKQKDIENLELELLTISENIKVLKSNKANLIDRIEDLKKTTK